MRAATSLLALFSSRKLIVEFTSNKIRKPKKSSQYGGIPYRYISYESAIKPKTKKTTR
jgi:hypothetical protein